MPESFGFYQPITMSLAVPDGPPEYKAGWHSGCKTALANKTFANASVYDDGKGPDFGNGIYQHDPGFQTGWGQGWFACVLHISQFVGDPEGNKFRSFAKGPLE
jgi:hypothetical protein